MDLNWWLAFSAGFVSFFSPCVWPIVPGFMSRLASLELADWDRPTLRKRARAVAEALAFSVGLMFSFSALALSSSSVLSYLLRSRGAIRSFTALGLLAVGAWMLLPGLEEVSLDLPGGRRMRSFLDRLERARLPGIGLGSFLLGSLFGLIWVPCVGPILASIVMLAAKGDSYLEALVLMGFYSLGFSVPFALLALFLGKALAWLEALGKRGHALRRAVGLLFLVASFSLLSL